MVQNFNIALTKAVLAISLSLRCSESHQATCFTMVKTAIDSSTPILKFCTTNKINYLRKRRKILESKELAFPGAPLQNLRPVMMIITIRGSLLLFSPPARIAALFCRDIVVKNQNLSAVKMTKILTLLPVLYTLP